MILKNWYNVLKAYRAQQNIIDAITTIYGGKEKASYYSDRDVIPTLTLRPTGGLYTSSSGASYSWICVGSGTTPATVDDYKLENLITSGLSGLLSMSVDEDKDATYILTLTNTSGSDITIGEVGMLCPYFQTNSNSFRELALMERTVLDSPFTIPAGGVGVLNYAIKVNYPIANDGTLPSGEEVGF